MSVRSTIVFRHVVLISLAFGGDECTADSPKLTDNRLEITLFAEDPDIVTPIGMAIDSRDRIFVIESHTHHPPSDYEGPAGDRIKVFVDDDHDGDADSVSIFADGIQQAMNLAFSPDGQLCCVCAREVLQLIDRDDDGVCDEKRQILKLETSERYAHNSLLGITFDRDGWMYVARGNVASRAHRLRGQDDSFVAGYGDGGNVVRCRADGTQLEEFATGFWNPFDLKFDRNGRLLLVDNDPDARGPNRLVHVVPGGDYGYKSLYGGGGNHPFQGWDGSLPGTLPYIAGTGEAPSGLIDCRRTALPEDYRRSLLTTIWNENSIERFELRTQGVSVTSSPRRVFLQGGKNFRPVAIDADSRGNLYVTDWVLVDYPNHGRGRIWRISNKTKFDRITPQAYFDPPSVSQSELRDTTEDASVEKLTSLLTSGDPFARHAAIMRLAAEDMAEYRAKLRANSDAQLRLCALLASKRSDLQQPKLIQEFLGDDDAVVRRAALQWAGESLDVALRPTVKTAMLAGPVDGPLFEAYLAAVENLSGGFAAAYQSRTGDKSNALPRRLPDGHLSDITQDGRFDDAVRGLAIGKLSEADVATHAEWLATTLRSTNNSLSRAVARRCAGAGETPAPLRKALVDVAVDPSRTAAVRCEALLAVGSSGGGPHDRILPLLSDDEENVAVEAARTLRAWLDGGRAEDAVPAVQAMHLRHAVAERLAPAQGGQLFPDLATMQLERPTSNSEWHQALAEGGDPDRGRRVFLTARVSCTKCHAIGGRGGMLGPDLDGVAESKTQQQIVESILDPSAAFAPQYQAWVVLTADGRLHRGLQLDHKANGAIVLTLENGDLQRFTAEEIDDYFASPQSLMPEGLVDLMTVGEARDLVAFLASLKN